MSNNDCENIQTALAECDLRHMSRELVSHVETCPDCAAYLQRLQRLQNDLAGLGAGDVSENVPDHLVQTTLQNINTKHNDGATVTNPPGLHSKWASGFAALFVCLGVITLLQQYQPRPDSGELFSGFNDIGTEFKLGETVFEPPARLPEGEANESLSSLAKADSDYADREQAKKKEKGGEKRRVLAFSAPATEPASAAKPQPKVLHKRAGVVMGSGQEAFADISTAGKSLQYEFQSPFKKEVVPMMHDADALEGAGRLGENYSGSVGELRRDTMSGRIESAGAGRLKLVMPGPPVTAEPEEADEIQVISDDDAYNSTEHAQQLAADYLREYDRIDNVSFLSATGYWANTYLPGDPNMRLLQARLASWDRSEVAPLLQSDVSLENSSSAFHRPFDPPSNAALAVYLHSDHSAVQEPTRLRVQVGLQATERFSGHRPAMNVGIVLDASGIGMDALASVKALLRAMAQAVQPGDRFSLTVAGSQGGVWIYPQEFRLGHIQVALDKLLATQENPGVNVNTSLLEALHAATEVVQQYDDPGSVLGSSSIILITASSLSRHIEQLQVLAHRNATNGITLSVFPLGGAVSIEDVDRLVLSGQGHRRILSTPEDAPQLVNTELLSSSRAVARAVRLRIRLSPGVKLIQVLGSHRLDEPHAQRVREAERSIDQRLSRNFGIVADRGEDEEGIQIVIPSFFAGDSHVVLLDVIAEGSGSIADVTVRYKDLLYLRNDVARGNLNLPAGENMPSILEHKVTKNLLSFTLSQHVRLAADYLAAGDAGAAVETLQHVLRLYKGLRHIIPNWYEDQELIKDETLLTRYLALLQSTDIRDQASYVADSLRVSGHRKQLSGNGSL